ncbi:hypothetical protein BDY24DRAFT_409847, partial [Mrakia frigida]|uniref:uncharacterized protein n=1 Tax=Mrakia frigida TaxID=29902 RepID=UPI003FCC163F
MSPHSNSTDPRNPRRAQTVDQPSYYPPPDQQQQQQYQHDYQQGPPRGNSSQRWSGESPYGGGGQAYGAPPQHQISYHATQSTPSLHQPPPAPPSSSSMPPLPPSYDVPSSNLDPTADLNFNALRVSDPLPRSNTSMSNRSGPPQSSGYGRGGGGGGAPSVYSLDMGSVGSGGGQPEI